VKYALLTALIVIICPLTGICQQPVRARTDAGKEVILNADGTWKYATESPPKRPTVAAFNKLSGANKLFKPDRGDFRFWYDETKWQLSTRSLEPGTTTFNLKRGDGYGVLIVEEIGMPISSLKIIALENAKEAAPDAKITFEETRTVNGKEVLCMKIDGTVNQIPFRYFGYYYGGKQGTVQLITFTAQSLFEKYEPDFVAFLSGLEIE
jgi:hypothetical protein